MEIWLPDKDDHPFIDSMTDERTDTLWVTGGGPDDGASVSIVGLCVCVLRFRNKVLVFNFKVFVYVWKCFVF